MTEERAGLRQAPSKAEELTKEKMVLDRDIKFMISQSDPRERVAMREILEHKRRELRRMEDEMQRLSSNNRRTGKNSDGRSRGHGSARSTRS